MSAEWLHSYETFVNDMGRKPSALHTLERIDNDGPYSRENCRWATRNEQAVNHSKNRRVTVNGVTQTISQWERAIGARGISRRLRRGWTDEEAVTIPLGGKRTA